MDKENIWKNGKSCGIKNCSRSGHNEQFCIEFHQKNAKIVHASMIGDGSKIIFRKKGDYSDSTTDTHIFFEKHLSLANIFKKASDDLDLQFIKQYLKSHEVKKGYEPGDIVLSRKGHKSTMFHPCARILSVRKAIRSAVYVWSPSCDDVWMYLIKHLDIDRTVETQSECDTGGAQGEVYAGELKLLWSRRTHNSNNKFEMIAKAWKIAYWMQLNKTLLSVKQVFINLAYLFEGKMRDSEVDRHTVSVQVPIQFWRDDIEPHIDHALQHTPMPRPHNNIWALHLEDDETVNIFGQEQVFKNEFTVMPGPQQIEEGTEPSAPQFQTKCWYFYDARLSYSLNTQNLACRATITYKEG